MGEENQMQIYVYLLDEPVDVWRPVQAIEKGNGLYQIVSENLDTDDERWEFTTGDIVRVKEKLFSGNQAGFVAVEKIA